MVLGSAERIHNTPELTHLPVIMLTAKGYELDRSEVNRLFGIRAVVNKPFSPRQVFSMVEDLLSPSGKLTEIGFATSENLSL